MSRFFESLKRQVSKPLSFTARGSSAICTFAGANSAGSWLGITSTLFAARDIYLSNNDLMKKSKKYIELTKNTPIDERGFLNPVKYYTAASVFLAITFTADIIRIIDSFKDSDQNKNSSSLDFAKYLSLSFYIAYQGSEWFSKFLHDLIANESPMSNQNEQAQSGSEVDDEDAHSTSEYTEYRM